MKFDFLKLINIPLFIHTKTYCTKKDRLFNILTLTFFWNLFFFFAWITFCKPCTLPICLSTWFFFPDNNQLSDLFDLVEEEEGEGKTVASWSVWSFAHAQWPYLHQAPPKCLIQLINGYSNFAALGDAADYLLSHEIISFESATAKTTLDVTTWRFSIKVFRIYLLQSHANQLNI